MSTYTKALLLSMCSKIKGADVIGNFENLNEERLKSLLREHNRLRFKELPVLAMKWVMKAGANQVAQRFPEVKKYINPENIEVALTDEEALCIIEDSKGGSGKRQNVYMVSAMNVMKDLLGASLSNLTELADSFSGATIPKISLDNLPEETKTNHLENIDAGTSDDDFTALRESENTEVISPGEYNPLASNDDDEEMSVVETESCEKWVNQLPDTPPKPITFEDISAQANNIINKIKSFNPQPFIKNPSPIQSPAVTPTIPTPPPIENQSIPTPPPIEDTTLRVNNENIFTVTPKPIEIEEPIVIKTMETTTSAQDDEVSSIVSNQSSTSTVPTIYEAVEAEIEPNDSISNKGSEDEDDDDALSIRPKFKKVTRSRTVSVVSSSTRSSIKSAKMKQSIKDYI